MSPLPPPLDWVSEPRPGWLRPTLAAAVPWPDPGHAGCPCGVPVGAGWEAGGGFLKTIVLTNKNRVLVKIRSEFVQDDVSLIVMASNTIELFCIFLIYHCSYSHCFLFRTFVVPFW